ncbi:MAG: hypothetical protein LBU42_00235 [Prevotellaceae bacterium]|nr:hypothetical protein [Prevotellaceae bacterium]
MKAPHDWLPRDHTGLEMGMPKRPSGERTPSPVAPPTALQRQPILHSPLKRRQPLPTEN